MTDDLISRREAIDAVCSVCNAVKPEFRGKKCIHYNEGCEEIERLRKIPSELDWIPVTKKLPKKTDLYYVTIRDEDGTDYTSCMTYCINLARWEVEVNVIAWMPLPEPYEEDK